MSLSNSAENSILNHILRNVDWNIPAVYVSLHISDPGETGTGEVNATWYTTGKRKQPVSGWNAADTVIPSNGATNNGLIEFATVSGANVVVTHFGLWTADAGGTFLYGGAFDSSKQFSSGSTPKIFDQELNIIANDPFSNYLKPRIIDHLLGTTTWTNPTSVQLALYTSNPTAADNGNEVLGGRGYTRQTLTFTAPSGGATQNSGAVDFGPATNSWGDVSHWGIRDNSGANLLIFGAWNSPDSPVNGDDYILQSGDLDITAS